MRILLNVFIIDQNLAMNLSLAIVHWLTRKTFFEKLWTLQETYLIQGECLADMGTYLALGVDIQTICHKLLEGRVVHEGIPAEVKTDGGDALKQQDVGRDPRNISAGKPYHNGPALPSNAARIETTTLIHSFSSVQLYWSFRKEICFVHIIQYTWIKNTYKQTITCTHRIFFALT